MTKSSPQSPIAAIRVGEDDSMEVLCLYAPGLPPGEYDLYCEPPTPGGQKVPFFQSDCQHDLLKLDTTIEVIDKWKAKCKVCIEFFDLPGRPEKTFGEHYRAAFNLAQEQLEDDGLWFKAETASEAYLQRALRKLHAAIEGEPIIFRDEIGSEKTSVPHAMQSHTMQCMSNYFDFHTNKPYACDCALNGRAE